MAREMANLDKPYRVVCRAVRLGPTVTGTRRYDNSTYIIFEQGKTYGEAIYGPYAKPGLAKSQGKRALNQFLYQNQVALEKNEPEPWDIVMDVQVADVKWMSV